MLEKEGSNFDVENCVGLTETLEEPGANYLPKAWGCAKPGGTRRKAGGTRQNPAETWRKRGGNVTETWRDRKKSKLKGGVVGSINQ